MLRVGVEVRDAGSPLDLPAVEQLVAKLRKLDVDRGCIVSRAGFTSEARRAAGDGGVEACTLAEVDHPSWWRVSTAEVRRDEVELVEMRVNFSPEELPTVNELLAGVDGKQVVITMSDGESRTLPDFVAAQGIRAIEGPDLAHMTDQDMYTLLLDLGGLAGAVASCPRGPLPIPRSIHALFRVHRHTEFVDLAAFDGPGGVTAFAGVSSSLQRQMTYVASENDDGSRDIFISLDEPRPRTTTIESRS